MLLFIGGHPRSGTTLLKNICTSHPEVHVTPEYRYLMGMGRPYRGYARHQRDYLRRKGVDTWFMISGGHTPVRRRVGWWGKQALFTARYLRALRTVAPDRVDAAAVDAALRHLYPDLRIVGDKYPGYCRRLESLVGREELSGILIYRDGRDVVSSALRMARTNWKGSRFAHKLDTPRKVAVRWVRAIEAMERHAGLIYTVRYEDLIQRPGSVLEALGDWLGVDPSEFRPPTIRAGSVGKYRVGLTQTELATVMAVAGPTMERLGYTVEARS